MRMKMLVLGALSGLAAPAAGQTITQVIDAAGDGRGHVLTGPEALAVDGAGNVYVAGVHSHNVFRIGPDGGVRQVVDGTGDGQGHPLEQPSDLALDRDGNLFVVGRMSQNVFRIAPDGVVTQVIDAAGDGQGHLLDYPFSVAVGGPGNVYVAGMSSHYFRIAADGTITAFPTPAHWPLRIAATGADVVYMAGFLGDDGYRVEPDGTVTHLIGAGGDGAGNAFSIGYGVAVGREGSVYMAATWSQNVFRIEPSGQITEIIDSDGDGLGNPLASWFGIYAPFEVAVGNSGSVYVNGHVSHNAFRIDADGTITQIIDRTGDGAGNALQLPAGIAVDRGGAVYVSGAGSHNVFRID